MAHDTRRSLRGDIQPIVAFASNNVCAHWNFARHDPDGSHDFAPDHLSQIELREHQTAVSKFALFAK